MLTLRRFARPLPWRRFLSLSWPMALAGIVQPLTQLTDAALLGHLQPPDYLAAVVVGGPLLTFLLWIFSFLRMGSCAEVGAQWGRQSLPAVIQVYQRYQTVGLLLSGLSIAAALLVVPALTSFMTTSDNVAELAKHYVFIRLLAAPATLLSYVILGTLIGIQRTKQTLWLALIINAVNLVLDILLIKVFNLASNGAAMASVAAEYVGLFIGAWLLYKSLHSATAERKGLGISVSKLLIPQLKVLLKQAKTSKGFRLADLTTSSTFTLNRDLLIRTFFMLLTLNTFIGFAGQLSVSELAAIGLLMQLSYFLACGVDGFANACETLCAQALGAKSRRALVRRVETWTASGMTAGLGLAAILMVLLIAGDRLWINLMSSQLDTQEALSELFLWFAIFPLLSLPAFILDGVYIGIRFAYWMRQVIVYSYFLVLLPVGAMAVFIFDSSLALLASLLLFTLARSLAMLWPMVVGGQVKAKLMKHESERS